jgi:alpha-L-fucosidase
VRKRRPPIPKQIQGKFSAQNIVDGKPRTFWMAEDWCGPVELEVHLPQAVRFNRIMLQEHIESGQRIEAFRCEVWLDGGWREIARGTTVGFKRLLRFNTVESGKVRIRLLESRVCPTLSEIGLFMEAP